MLLKRKDLVMLFILSAGFAGAATMVWLLAGSAEALALVWLTFTALAGLVLASFRRTRELFDRQSQEQSDVYHQIEAFVSLTNTLKMRQPLPPMRGWAVSPDFANVLVGLIRERRPRRILELGGGVSTLVAAYCLEEIGEGSIVSLDHDAAYAEATRRNLRRHRLERLATVLHAPLITVQAAAQEYRWYDCSALSKDGEFDLLVVDGPPAGSQPEVRYPALPLLMKRLSATAAILLDDAGRGDERAILERWLREFPEFAREDLATEKGAAILRRGGVAVNAMRTAA